MTATPHPIFVLFFAKRSDAQLALSIAYLSPDVRNEDYDYCVARERGLEIKALEELRLPYVLLTPDEIIGHNLAHDITEESLTLHQWIYRGALSARLFNYLDSTGGRLGYEHVLRWPNWVGPKFLSRSVSCVTFDEFTKSARHECDIEQNPYAWPLFIKTVGKGNPTWRAFSLREVFTQQEWVARTLLRGELGSDPKGKLFGIHYASKNHNDSAMYILDAPKPFFNEYLGESTLNPKRWHAIDDDLIVSDVMHIASDNFGEEEYRVFIVGGKVSSISRKLDYERAKVPMDVSFFAIQVATECGDGSSPHGGHYVVDVARTNLGLVVVEMNPLCASGRYFGNCPLRLFSDFSRALNINGFELKEKPDDVHLALFGTPFSQHEIHMQSELNTELNNLSASLFKSLTTHTTDPEIN